MFQCKSYKLYMYPNCLHGIQFVNKKLLRLIRIILLSKSSNGWLPEALSSIYVVIVTKRDMNKNADIIPSFSNRFCSAYVLNSDISLNLSWKSKKAMLYATSCMHEQHTARYLFHYRFASSLNIPPKFVFYKNHTYENCKLKMCVCSKSHVLGTRTKFQFKIPIMNVISVVVYFLKKLW